MKINSHYNEFGNAISGIAGASVIESIPQLSGLDSIGIAASLQTPAMFSSASEIAMRNLDAISRAIDMVPKIDAGLSSALSLLDRIGSLDALENHQRMMETLGNALSTYSSLAERISAIEDNYSGIMAATEALHQRLSIIDTLGLDYTRLTSAVGTVLQRIAIDEECEIEDLSELVAETYEAETEEEKAILNEVTSQSTTTEAVKSRTQFSEIVKRIAIFLLGAFMTSLIDIGMNKVLVQNPPVINNYYVQNITNTLSVEGYDIEQLDLWGYRIVNQDVVLRAKPGKSAYVTGRLPKGTVVRVTEKYRKWVEIAWRDEAGEIKHGWLQNWKLSNFSE